MTYTNLLHICALISEACNTSIWTCILLQWIWGTQNTNNLQLDSHSLSLFVEIWPPLHSACFLPSFVISHGSFPRAHSPSYFWRILMKSRDALSFSTEMVFVILSAGFFFMLIFTKSINLSSITHWRILWYLTSMCFILLWYLWSLARWIALWLSQWTLT